MSMYATITAFCILAMGLIFAGGAIFVVGSEMAGLALAGLGAGWMGILFGVLMRAASRNPAV